jgi:hypothetical protein
VERRRQRQMCIRDSFCPKESEVTTRATSNKAIFLDILAYINRANIKKNIGNLPMFLFCI